jgi:hypothetical protein
MSRTTRAAALTGLTAATVSTGLLLAPAALAAAPAAPVVAPSTVEAEETFIVSGTDCPEGVPGNPNVVVVFIDDGSEYGLGSEERWIEGGKWSTELAFEAGTKPGAYEVHAACVDYLGLYVEGATFTTEIVYPVATVTLAGATTPAPPTETAAPTPATPEAKPTGAIRGSQANTAGVASPDGGSATGDSAAPGRKVVKVLTGFKPKEVVTVTLHSTPQTVGTFTADANGTVTVEFTVPAGTPTGEHTLVYEGSMGTYFQESFTVAAAAGTSNASASSLAYTGADVALPLGLGVGALALGGGLVFAARRRASEGSQA